MIRPQWRGDGRELFFVDDGRLMAARVSDDPALSVSPATPLFALPSTEYAVDRAGDRFLCSDDDVSGIVVGEGDAELAWGALVPSQLRQVDVVDIAG